MKPGRKLTVKDFLKDLTSNQEPLLVVSEDLPIAELVDRMTRLADDRIILVADQSERIQGLISLGDLARHLKHTRSTELHFHSQPPAQKRSYKGRNIRHSGREILHQITAETAGDIMCKEIRSCRPDEQLSEAIHKMLDGEVIKILPVVNENGSLAGSIHLLDIMQYFINTVSAD